MAPIESITTTSLSLALDAASLRQQVIAANIANATTVGFAPQRVSFEAQVDEALRAQSPSGPSPVLPGGPLRVEVSTATNVFGEPASVQLDSEVAALAQNNLHYQVLVRALNRHLSVLSSAVNEGRR